MKLREIRMPKLTPTTKKVLLALAVVFVFTNPELRALLMLTELMGAEVLLFFCYIQLKATLPLLNDTLARLWELSLPMVLVSAKAFKLMVVGLLPRQEFWLSSRSACTYCKVAVTRLASSVRTFA
jgi:hypothetical protein